MKRLVAWLTLAAALGTAAPLGAQNADERLLRGSAGASFAIAAPTGEFSDYVGTGWGFGGHFALGIAGEGVLGLRLGGGYINYGRETQPVCLSETVGCRIVVDLTTSNDILYLNFGPELSLPVGPVRPYANLSAGFAYFATVSSVNGTGNFDNDDFARTTNLDDFTFAWQAGTGLRIELPWGNVPIWLDLGVRHHRNGEAEYLTEGGIIDHPDGSITLNPIQSEANVVAIQIGVTVGIRW